MDRLQMVDKPNPVHTGDYEIGDDQVGVDPSVPLDRSGSILCEIQVVAQLGLQNRTQESAGLRLLIDDQ